VTTTYQAGKAPSGAPWTWNKLAFHFIEIRGSGVVGDFHVENDDEANAICRAAHEAQVMRAMLDLVVLCGACESCSDRAIAAFSEFPK